MHTRVFGLIGSSLAHSFSRKYFEEKFRKERITDAIYKNFELSTIDKFPSLILQQPDLCGLNVTIPYKESVIPFLDRVEGDAQTIGAVNCIECKRGKRIGHNTDVIGFRESLKPLLKKEHRSALILGTGGANKAVAFVLNECKIDFKNVSLHPQPGEYSYTELNRQVIAENRIIINASPLGMAPYDYLSPQIPYEFITPKHLLFDLIYNPAETIFLKKGKERGAVVKNGLEMLMIQAEKSWELWNK